MQAPLELLRPGLVQWRIDSQPYPRDNRWVARCVPYLDASTVAAMLDGWVGAHRWWDRYEPVEIGGGQGLLCHLTIAFPDDTEVTKTDIGVSPGGSPELAVKGMMSDAFKRCATLKWGVGRAVYFMEGQWLHVVGKVEGDRLTRARIDPKLDLLEVSAQQIQQVIDAATLTVPE